MIERCNHTTATLCASCKEKNYVEEMMKQNKSRNKKLIVAINLLKEILPMQGCIQCQENYTSCGDHGDIRETTKKIELFLKENAI